MEDHVLRWAGSPSEDLLNVSKVFMKSLLDLLVHGTSYCHDNYLSIPMLTVRILQRTTLGTHFILLQPRGNLGEDHPEHPWMPPQTHPCSSYMTAWTSWQTSAAAHMYGGSPQCSHTSGLVTATSVKIYLVIFHPI